MSTPYSHTHFVHLKSKILHFPESGYIRINGRVAARQHNTIVIWIFIYRPG